MPLSKITSYPGMDLLAAKIYLPRMMRNLRNDARYRQGRDYLDELWKGDL